MKAGLEIHQRLNTKKLFCNCSTGMKEEPVSEKIMRKLRVVPGELGISDQAAMYEFTKNKIFNYHLFDEESCLVDTDEEPPRPINEDALEVSLQVAKMLKADIPDELHMMRKTVIDGSNTSAFQRTGVIGLNGEIEASFGKVSIETIALEEESSQIISKDGDATTYALNRLGIPLIEIATGPDMNSPEQVKEVAQILGMLLRSTGKVKRGIGTIRQDINVSIEGGERVEIKGVQDLDLMKDIVLREVERQENLLKIRDRLSETSFSEIIDATSIFNNTKNSVLERGLEQGKQVYAFLLKGFSGVLKEPISGNKTLGKELAECAIAQGTKGMMHSDEDVSKYDLTREFSQLSKQMNKEERDVLCIVLSEDEKPAEAVIERARILEREIPKETRKANEDGTSSFMRPLPGGDRMYPETDVPYIEITQDLLDKIEIPETLEERKQKYLERGLPEPLIDNILRGDKINFFEKYLDRDDVSKIGELLTSQFTTLRREGVDVDSVSEEELDKLVEKLNELPKESINDIVKDMSNGLLFSDIMNKMDKVGTEEAESIIEDLIDTNQKLIAEKGEKAFQVLMGEAMKQLRGKVSGEIIADILKTRLERSL